MNTSRLFSVCCLVLLTGLLGAVEIPETDLSDQEIRERAQALEEERQQLLDQHGGHLPLGSYNPSDVPTSSVPTNGAEARATVERTVAAALETWDRAAADAAGKSRSDPPERYDHRLEGIGTLWVFWALDAPGIQQLPGRLGALEAALPDLTIYEVPLNPASKIWQWKQQVESLNERWKTIEDNDQALSEWRQFVDSNQHMMTMAARRGRSGMQAFPNLAVAKQLQVDSVPSFYYITPVGTIHTLDGLGTVPDLALWVQRCLQWDLEQKKKGAKP